MAVRTTAGSDTIDIDFVVFFSVVVVPLKKKKEGAGLVFEKQYFSSQIITTVIMFLTNENPGLGSQCESCPQFKQSGQ